MIFKLIRRTVGFVLFLAALLFIPAGRLDWPGAWVFLGETGACAISSGLWLAAYDRGLLAERLGRRFERRQASWDRWLMAGAFTMWSTWFVAMGIEARYHGSTFPLWVNALGAALILCALAIVNWSLRENTYAAPVVRIQKEHGHKVVSTGPYRIVRHPMYAGAALFLLATPLLLDSLVGLVLAPGMATVFGVRAVMEERTLRTELDGYDDYMTKVRSRMIPGLW